MTGVRIVVAWAIGIVALVVAGHGFSSSILNCSSARVAD